VCFVVVHTRLCVPQCSCFLDSPLARWAKGSDAQSAFDTLREICYEPGGLGTTVIRGRAWPLLLGVARPATSGGRADQPPDPSDVAEEHDSEHQVRVCVRSFDARQWSDGRKQRFCRQRASSQWSWGK